MPLTSGQQFELTRNIPRLGLKAGHPVTVEGQKAESIYEVSAWSEKDRRSHQVMVEEEWLMPPYTPEEEETLREWAAENEKIAAKLSNEDLINGLSLVGPRVATPQEIEAMTGEEAREYFATHFKAGLASGIKKAKSEAILEVVLKLADPDRIARAAEEFKKVDAQRNSGGKCPVCQAPAGSHYMSCDWQGNGVREAQ